MKSRVVFVTGLAILAACGLARADEWQLLRGRGAEVYYLDTDLRSAFAKDHAQALPEAQRELPPATAPAFDWTARVKRSHNYSQRGDPYCWAFAAVTAFEWNWAVRNGGTAPQLAVQPILGRVQAEKTGVPFRLAMEGLLEQGTCPLKMYPYTGKAERVRTGVEFSYRAIAWGYVAGTHSQLPETPRIKQALLEHGPLVAGVYTTPRFHAYKGGVYDERFTPPKDRPAGDHGLVIVGWDDRKGRSGCWRVQNSWGEAWGEGGLMWIEYGCNNIGYDACWVRPQSVHYKLPADAHKQISRQTAPFANWPKALEVAPAPAAAPAQVMPAEALKMQGKRVQVEFVVRGYGTVSPAGDLDLLSERSRQDEQCLVVRLLKSEFDRFPAQDVKTLVEHYGGKRIRVMGTVQPYFYGFGNRMIVEVADPANIEVVK